MARYTVRGNLLAEPEVRTTDSGKDVINLRVAENLGYPGKDGWVETGTKVYDISVWENHPLFDNILDSGIPTGTQVIAEVGDRGDGVRVYETKKDGADLGVDGIGAVFTVDLFELATSLRFATVEVTRNKKKSSRRNDDDEAPRRSSRSRRNDDDDEDEAPKRSSRSRAKDADDDEDEAPKRSSRSRSSKSDDDEAPKRRSGSASRGRASRSSKSDDDAF